MLQHKDGWPWTSTCDWNGCWCKHNPQKQNNVKESQTTTGVSSTLKSPSCVDASDVFATWTTCKHLSIKVNQSQDALWTATKSCHQTDGECIICSVKPCIGNFALMSQQWFQIKHLLENGWTKLVRLRQNCLLSSCTVVGSATKRHQPGQPAKTVMFWQNSKIKPSIASPHVAVHSLKLCALFCHQCKWQAKSEIFHLGHKFVTMFPSLLLRLLLLTFTKKVTHFHILESCVVKCFFSASDQRSSGPTSLLVVLMRRLCWLQKWGSNLDHVCKQNQCCRSGAKCQFFTLHFLANGLLWWAPINDLNNSIQLLTHLNRTELARSSLFLTTNNVHCVKWNVGCAFSVHHGFWSHIDVEVGFVELRCPRSCSLKPKLLSFLWEEKTS